MMVSSIIPPCSFKRTDRVEVNGLSESSDEGQRVNRNSWAVGPVKLCCSIWDTSNKPASDRTCLWAVAVSWACERV